MAHCVRAEPRQSLSEIRMGVAGGGLSDLNHRDDMGGQGGAGEPAMQVPDCTRKATRCGGAGGADEAPPLRYLVLASAAAATSASVAELWVLALTSPKGADQMRPR